MSSSSPLPPLNFAALADALLPLARTLVPEWLPGGDFKGHEYACGSVQGGAGGSCSVNLNTGQWADFATGEQGGDLVSLYAASRALTMGKAAIELACAHGLEQVAGVVRASGRAAVATPPRPAPPPSRPPPDREKWKTIRPVPPSVRHLATYRHHHRRPEDIVHVSEYWINDDLQGYVVRFRTSDGGKDDIPYTWCESERDGAAKWTWRQFDELRPLYLPGRQLPGGRTVIVVEGEKKGRLLQALLDEGAPNTYCVMSWPGGCKAWAKADWSLAAGAHVLLWPDADAKREPLTKAEREANPDKAAQLVLQQSKPLLPVDKQPGMAAMLGLGARLRDAHACTVQLLAIPAPGDVPDGWDAGDAIEKDGWTFERVLQFFGTAAALPAAADAPAPGAAGGSGAPPPARESPVETGGEEDAFEEYLAWICAEAKIQRHELGMSRKLLIEALRRAPALKGCLGFDDLRGAPCTTRPWPWREKAGPLQDTDDLRLGAWLCDTYRVKPSSRASLQEAVDTVADSNHFHPVRDWLQGLEHDGKSRIDKWLIYALRMDPEELTPRRQKFLELMGRFLLMGLVARVMNPGCKFDYAPVFEGLPGMGKSTLVKVLVGAEFFSDTHFDIGNGKDGMEQLDGLWAYELSEMTAFRRADSEQVKQFFSSTIDRYRGAYGRYVQPHPRQCVIFCTTNKRQYLYDLTGNRRFWPVWCYLPIRLEWVAKFRAQLFAEAFALYSAGKRYYPTPEEEKQYFHPEQELRLVETSVQSRLYELLTREGALDNARATAGLNVMTEFVTLADLVTALGADAAKSTSVLEGQIRGWLESMGWEYGRESKGQRRRGYFRPQAWPPKFDDERQPEAGAKQDHADPGRGGWDGGSDEVPF